jgi:hypothetical protein
MNILVHPGQMNDGEYLRSILNSHLGKAMEDEFTVNSLNSAFR